MHPTSRICTRSEWISQLYTNKPVCAYTCTYSYNDVCVCMCVYKFTSVGRKKYPFQHKHYEGRQVSACRLWSPSHFNPEPSWVSPKKCRELVAGVEGSHIPYRNSPLVAASWSLSLTIFDSLTIGNPRICWDLLQVNSLFSWQTPWWGWGLKLWACENPTWSRCQKDPKNCGNLRNMYILLVSLRGMSISISIYWTNYDEPNISKL